MSDNVLVQIIMYTIIIILIPIFIDILFRITVRRKRKTSLFHKAIYQSKKTKKPLIIYNSPADGYMINDISKHKLDPIKLNGHILDVIPKMEDNSKVILISETLEYIDNVDDLVNQLKRVSGDDLYINNFEKKSPRIYFDNRIINVIDKPYYMGTDCNIKMSEPTMVQKKISKFYSHIMMVLPQRLIYDDPIYKFDDKL